jgi:hypothetical protein
MEVEAHIDKSQDMHVEMDIGKRPTQEHVQMEIGKCTCRWT